MIRDRKYLDYLRTQRCVVTGQYGTEHDPVEACHIGTAGKGIKSPDDEALPILHSIHAQMHQSGEISYLRHALPASVLRLCLRAYARELYQEKKAS